MRVLTYGTFDLLHVGHINILRRARELGDELYVGLSTDEFNAIKHKTSFMSFEDRRVILEAVRYVDKVFPETHWDNKISDVQKYDIDLFVMGSDWEGEFDFLSEHCDVMYLPRTEGVSSTLLKKKKGI